jgi:type IV pilus assembly protein PilB
MNAPAFLLASTTNVIIAQRLVRKICGSCIESYKISPETKKLVEAQLALLGDAHVKKIPETLYKGKGCKICGNTGYQSQIGIYEMLKVTEAVRDLILKQSSGTDIKKQAIKDGMVTMFEDGLQKVEQGITTIEEVIRVVRE